MKTKKAMKLLGCKTQADMAEVLGMKQPAISCWGEDVPFSKQCLIRCVLIDREKNKWPKYVQDFLKKTSN